ncbi:hypothetical protein N7486_002839 [Penicillium sp. IBT 16267x]|nr:hypothetical protein N7486_002839 [Penicillium sp. IBT 16267x]
MPIPPFTLFRAPSTENDSTHHQDVEAKGVINSLVGREATTNLAVKVKNYHGLPLSAPPTSKYFDYTLHRDDEFSIAFPIVFDRDVNGNGLVFGNFFDHPIEHNVPVQPSLRRYGGILEKQGVPTTAEGREEFFQAAEY